MDTLVILETEGTSCDDVGSIVPKMMWFSAGL